MTVKELISVLEDLADDGYGDHDVTVGYDGSTNNRITDVYYKVSDNEVVIDHE